MNRPRHPSGRPIRRNETKERSIWRIPDIEPNVPRLRRDAQTEAIGFVHDFGDNDDHE